MTRFLRSFTFALRGIRTAFADQPNLRIHGLVALVVICTGFYFNITATEWAVIMLTIALVMGLEMVNSAIEKVVDLVSPEYHLLAGKAKDIAAGAVLFAAAMAVVVGVVVFGKYV